MESILQRIIIRKKNNFIIKSRLLSHPTLHISGVSHVNKLYHTDLHASLILYANLKCFSLTIFTRKNVNSVQKFLEIRSWLLLIFLIFLFTESIKSGSHLSKKLVLFASIEKWKPFKNDQKYFIHYIVT